MRHTNRQTATRTLTDLYRALDRQRAVTITALKEEKDSAGRRTGRLVETIRTIEIWDIRTTAAGHIVIKAMDRESGESRTFRLDRITTYTLHRSSCTIPRTDDDTEPTTIPAPRSATAVIARELGRDYHPTRRRTVALAA